MKGYPKHYLRALLAALLFLFLSGLLLAPETLFLKGEIDVPWRVSGTARIVTAALHATAAFIAAAFIGSLWSVHMRAGWRKKKQRVSGALLAANMVLLCFTAVGIYYLGDDGLGPLTALTHLGLGVALAPPFIWHWLKGRRKAQHAVAAHSVVPFAAKNGTGGRQQAKRNM
ncbi:hypothetical protein GCM10027277_34190 [Pseudoduganella ginsengisoli]|uniref:DUF4405 domain-containing protein n=1 Tax=Pseudoduganella ginsengisoli TaxID=1462440 RepID=A0A6L6Q8H1_9BURK|nr:hypothetical protein [Pseudoduganella ginsengisoli]MTW05551.1 hypothetical protein [Pseudoduganella ginsengisoli]